MTDSFATTVLGQTSSPKLAEFARDNSHYHQIKASGTNVEVLVIGRVSRGGKDVAAATLASMWKESGPEMLQRLGGHFALAVVDWEAREAMLAVDRFVTYELAWHRQADGTLHFGDSCARVAALMPTTKVDPQSIYEYIYCHVVPGPNSIFAGVRKMPPASYVHITPNGATVTEYWQPQFEERAGDVDERAEHLLETIARVVAAADVPGQTGCFLSGGLDSSTIAGCHSRHAGEASTAFTIGFDAPGYDEMHFSTAVSEHFGIDLVDYYVTAADIAESLPRIARAYDEPFGNSSAVPLLACATRAVEAGKSLLLAGDGGDEVFGGNERYLFQQYFRPYERSPQWLRRFLLDPLSACLPTKSGPALLRKAGRYFEQAKVPLPDRLEEYNFLHRMAPEAVFEDGFLGSVDQERPLREKRTRFWSIDAPTMLHRMLFLDWKYTLADNDLRKVGGMCDLAGIDVQYPLLHDDVVDIACGLPADLLIRGKELRFFFRRTVQDFLPATTLNKSKHGFGLPFGLWLSTHDPLRELVNDSISSMQRRHIFRRSFIEQMLNQHREEHAAYYGELIWLLTMLELWHQAQDDRPRHS